jgi:tyrosyl-DNA phosphodiesterase 2
MSGFRNTLYPLKAARFCSKGKWKRLTHRHEDNESVEHVSPPSFIRILSWNIDFMEDNREKRMRAALRHIQNTIFKCKSGEEPDPCCILLQEVHLNTFPIILANEWVRDHFIVTPVSTDKWPDPKGCPYGCVTLVSKGLPFVAASSLHYGSSIMGRNLLMVDVRVSTPEPASREVTLRIANTHLESLPRGAEARVDQMKLVGKMLKEDGLYGGIVGGDMNAIGPSDVPIVKNAGLRDACTLDEDDELGYTWGYQGGGDFPPGRLDKICYLPREGYVVSSPNVVGVDVKAGDQFVSDHYALLTTVDIF